MNFAYHYESIRMLATLRVQVFNTCQGDNNIKKMKLHFRVEWHDPKMKFSCAFIRHNDGP